MNCVNILWKAELMTNESGYLVEEIFKIGLKELTGSSGMLLVK